MVEMPLYRTGECLLPVNDRGLTTAGGGGDDFYKNSREPRPPSATGASSRKERARRDREAQRNATLQLRAVLPGELKDGIPMNGAQIGWY